MANKFTPMQELFRKEQRRLERAITREFRQTGVELDRSLVPKMPSRVTKKQLENIKQITPKQLREQSEYYRHDTGELVSYEEAKRLWREEQILTVNPVNFDPLEGTIDFYFETLIIWNKNFQSIMKAWVYGLVEKYGRKAVNRMLFDGIKSGLIVTPEIVYEEAKRSEYQAKMMEYLKVPIDIRAKLYEEAESSVGYEEPD